MYDICHPTYYKMSQLGCTDQVKLTTAFYVYMELCEVKCYWDVGYKYCEPLQLFYLEAKKSKNSPFTTFVPWPAIRNLSLELISNIQQELKKEKFTFVFIEADTTSVYYSVCSGIAKLISPEETKELRQKERKKFELEREIQRNTANLYERALLLARENHDRVSGSNMKKEGSAEPSTMSKIDSADKTDFELKICSDSVDKNNDDGSKNDNGLDIQSSETQSNSTSAPQNVDTQESEMV